MARVRHQVIVVGLTLGCGTADEDPPGASQTETAPTSAASDPSTSGPSTTASSTTAPKGTGETGSSGATSDSADSDASTGTTGDGTATTTGGDRPTVSRCSTARLDATTPTFAAPIELQSGGGTGGSEAGDLDGDGRDELIAQIQFRIYDWDDGQWISYSPLPDLGGRGDRFAGDIEVADMDGDLDLDIVVPDSDNSGTQGALSWFENPGSLDGAWVEHVITTFTGNGDSDTVTHLSELEVDDIDGDGTQDVVVRDISHGVWVLLQLSPGGQDWAPRVFVPVLPREGLELWDPDEDGRLDILLNGVWLQTPDDPVAGGYTVHPIVGMQDWYAPDLSTASVRDYASKVEAGDFDADGRLDLAITNSEELAGNSPNKPHGISVFLQPDDLVNGTWQEVVVTQDHWAWHTLALDDFDFDGSLDLITAISAVGTDDAGDQIVVWLNGGDQSFDPVTISSEHTVYQGAIADADGDGDCDFLAPDHFNSGPVRYFENLTVP